MGITKKAGGADSGIIAGRGQPPHVGRIIAEHKKVKDQGKSIGDLLTMREAPDIHFEPTKTERLTKAGELD